MVCISCARRRMEEKGEAAERVPRLVDIGDRVVYKLEYKKQLIGA